MKIRNQKRADRYSCLLQKMQSNKRTLLPPRRFMGISKHIVQNVL